MPGQDEKERRDAISSRIIDSKGFLPLYVLSAGNSVHPIYGVQTASRPANSHVLTSASARTRFYIKM